MRYSVLRVASVCYSMLILPIYAISIMPFASSNATDNETYVLPPMSMCHVLAFFADVRPRRKIPIASCSPESHVGRQINVDLRVQ